MQKINSSSLFNAKFVAIKLNLALLVAYFMVHKLAHLMIQVTIAAFIEKGLRKNGLITAIASDGQQALQMAVNEEFKMII